MAISREELLVFCSLIISRERLSLIFHIRTFNCYKDGFEEVDSVEEYIGNEGELEKVTEGRTSLHDNICGLICCSS